MQKIKITFLFIGLFASVSWLYLSIDKGIYLLAAYCACAAMIYVLGIYKTLCK